MTVIDYIYAKTGGQHELFLILHNFLAEYEGVRADIKYKIPFYSKTKPVCYISPQKNGGVEVVFWSALMMKDSLPLLDLKKRKWMAGLTYNSVKEIDFEVLDSIVLEALVCDMGCAK